MKENQNIKNKNTKNEKNSISVFERLYAKNYYHKRKCKNKFKLKFNPPKKNNISINDSKKAHSIFSFTKFKNPYDDLNNFRINITIKKIPKLRKPFEYKKEIDSEIKLIKANKENKDNKENIKENDDSDLLYNMNEDELNSLEYEQALIYDKRSYFQYYWSLLKSNHLILFTFFPANDYNLTSIKLTLFILSISLELTINGFFFTDETMHQIHEVHGEFELFYQIPQIIYSSIISTIISTVLQKLALTEDGFLTLKKMRNYEKAKKQCESIKKCLIIKFIFFIIFSFILMLFCWYYISSFCGVYINTQSHLFTDTIIGLSISMVFPFVMCLLPGSCRFPALKAKNKDRRCLYKFSGFAELINI